MKINLNPFAKGFRDHGNRSSLSVEILDSSNSIKLKLFVKKNLN